VVRGDRWNQRAKLAFHRTSQFLNPNSALPSVVVPALQEGDAAPFDEINQAVFFCYPATPATFQLHMAQRFRLADATEKIGQHRRNQLFDSLHGFAPCLLPIAQLF
jgi:hypothetical protein